MNGLRAVLDQGGDLDNSGVSPTQAMKVLPARTILRTVPAVCLGALLGFGCTTRGTKAPLAEEEFETQPSTSRVRVYVESQPNGAMIRVNGIRIGPTPRYVFLEVNENGHLLTDTTLSADWFLVGTSDISQIVYGTGDVAPNQIRFRRGAQTITVGGSTFR